MKINENEFIISSYGDKCLKFWNSNDISNISIINNIETDWTLGTICIINEDILCIQLIKNILGSKAIFCIYKCFDGLFLCSIINENGNHFLLKYKFENQDMKKIVEREKILSNDINTCIKLNDKTVASSSKDKLIKLWGNLFINYFILI